MNLRALPVAVALTAASFLQSAIAWDYDGHRLVNQIALGSLPTNFPAFVSAPEAQERIAFLGGEPDRWRNSPDLPLRHASSPDHFIDLEDLAPLELDPEKLPHFRYELMARIAITRDKHPERFPAIDPAKDADKTRAQAGYLPWTIAENYARLKSAFSYLKAFEEGGTPDEIANARQNVVYYMGVMGHFIGDAAQPLHTTKHYNGWIGDNPKGFTTTNRFHSWIDGGYLKKVGIGFKDVRERIRPAAQLPKGDSPAQRADVFPDAMRFIREQFELVEPLYQLEKDGKLTGEGERGIEGKEFLAKQILKAGQMLGDLWLTAYLEAPTDTYLKSALAQRKLTNGAPARPKAP